MEVEILRLASATKRLSGEPDDDKVAPSEELVVKQINGDYKVKNERMAALHKKTHDLLKMLSSWEINHVLRDKNTEADDLSKQGLSK